VCVEGEHGKVEGVFKRWSGKIAREEKMRPGENQPE
jgi:hypothetical protein